MKYFLNMHAFLTTASKVFLNVQSDSIEITDQIFEFLSYDNHFL